MKNTLIYTYITCTTLTLLSGSCCREVSCSNIEYDDQWIEIESKVGDQLIFSSTDAGNGTDLNVDTEFVFKNFNVEESQVGKRGKGDYCQKEYSYFLESQTETVSYKIILTARDEKISCSRSTSQSENGNAEVLYNNSNLNLSYSKYDSDLNDAIWSTATELTIGNGNYTIDGLQILLAKGTLYGFHVKENNKWYYAKD